MYALNSLVNISSIGTESSYFHFQYVPAAQEAVIGVVSQKQGEGFRVDIGSAHSANLDGLAFEGATKRNKPNLRVHYIQFPTFLL